MAQRSFAYQFHAFRLNPDAFHASVSATQLTDVNLNEALLEAHDWEDTTDALLQS